MIDRPGLQRVGCEIKNGRNRKPSPYRHAPYAVHTLHPRHAPHDRIVRRARHAPGYIMRVVLVKRTMPIMLAVFPFNLSTVRFSPADHTVHFRRDQRYLAAHGAPRAIPFGQLHKAPHWDISHSSFAFSRQPGLRILSRAKEESRRDAVPRVCSEQGGLGRTSSWSCTSPVAVDCTFRAQ